MFSAVGIRLRTLRIVNGVNQGRLLHELALVASQCPNLRELRIAFFELILSHDLEIVAATCPLFETVCLNADVREFQLEPIDNGS